MHHSRLIIMTPRSNNQSRFTPTGSHRPVGVGQPLRPVHYSPVTPGQQRISQPQAVVDVSQPIRAQQKAPHGPSQPQPNHNQYEAPVWVEKRSQGSHMPQEHRPKQVPNASSSHNHPAPHQGDRPTQSDTISIRLTIPNPRRFKLPPFVKQYPAFWWLVALLALLMFTVGYQVGWHHHAAAKPVVQPAFIDNRTGAGNG
jgi:hypothetical protein